MVPSAGPSPNQVVEAIHDELTQLRDRRRRALVGYLGLMAALVTLLALKPPKMPGLERNSAWVAELALFFLGNAIAASLAIGVPLVTRGRAYALGLFSAVLVIGGLAGVVDWSAPFVVAFGPGMKCFVHGTLLTTVAMAALGILSARLWRRFPNPSLFVAIAAASIGVIALHVACGAQDFVHLFGFHLTPAFVAFGLARALERARLKLDQAGM
ncbi:MAG: hypothetical protein H6729_17510 [Deltaproteobacteria bacterium]|nr:hypothetical protein [Deltaproteobacteria bacterium]